MENRHRESVSEISGGAGRAGVKAACRVARVRLFANLYWDHPVVVSEVLSSSSLIDTNRSLADFPLTALMFFFSRRSGWLNSSLFRKDLRSLIHLLLQRGTHAPVYPIKNDGITASPLVNCVLKLA